MGPPPSPCSWSCSSPSSPPWPWPDPQGFPRSVSGTSPSCPLSSVTRRPRLEAPSPPPRPPCTEIWSVCGRQSSLGKLLQQQQQQLRRQPHRPLLSVEAFSAVVCFF